MVLPKARGKSISDFWNFSEASTERMLTIWRQHEDHLVAKLGGEAERDRLIAMLERITATDTESRNSGSEAGGD